MRSQVTMLDINDCQLFRSTDRKKV